MMKRLAFASASLLAPLAALADAARPFAAPSTATSVTPSGIGNLGQVTVSLAIVLAVIFGAAWALRRMRGFNRTAGTSLEVIADIALGQKERAVLIRCGSKQLLLGVAPGRVSTLYVLEQPIDTSPPAGTGDAAKRPSFHSLLMRSLGK
jgi:flagellar protein FliO/FliZ